MKKEIATLSPKDIIEIINLSIYGTEGAFNIQPFIIMYLIAVYKNQTYIPKERRLLFVFVISLLLTGEYFLNYSFFWALLFVKIPNTDVKNVAGIHYSIKN